MSREELLTERNEIRRLRREGRCELCGSDEAWWHKFQPSVLLCADCLVNGNLDEHFELLGEIAEVL